MCLSLIGKNDILKRGSATAPLPITTYIAVGALTLHTGVALHILTNATQIFKHKKCLHEISRLPSAMYIMIGAANIRLLSKMPKNYIMFLNIFGKKKKGNYKRSLMWPSTPIIKALISF